MLIMNKSNQGWLKASVIEKMGQVMYNVLSSGRVRRVHTNQMRVDNNTDAAEDDLIKKPVQEPKPKKNLRAVTRSSPVLRPRNQLL